MRLLDPLFGCEDGAKCLDDRARVQGMLDFEAALAKAEGAAGVIPSSAAAVIAANCNAEWVNFAKLAESAKRAGNLAIPLIKQLTARVKQSDAEAARYVHWGATSQDAIDTGMVLQLRGATARLCEELNALCDAIARLAVRHRSTPIAGRTWMQHALPTTVGAKFAGWLDALLRTRERFEEMGKRCFALQFGGAVGTLAALGDRGQEVAEKLAAELKLPLPAMPWHAHRDRVAEIATVMGICAGTLGKIARDIALHTQTEIAEIAEPAEEGRGGSSTMPQKRNPVMCAAVLAAAARVPGLVSTILGAMPQEDERGLGGWHAEWETLPEIVRLTAGAVHLMRETIPKLEINAERMRRNLEITGGLIFAEAVSMALARKVGKAAAHEIVERASARAIAERQHLRNVLAGDAQVQGHLSPEELENLFDAKSYLGQAEAFVDRVVKTRVR